MRTLICCIPLSLGAAAVYAQTGTYTWQVSTNGGTTWSSQAISNPGDFIRVRLLAGWADVTGTDQGYAGGQFDGILIGASADDTVFNIIRPVPFSFTGISYPATLYDGGIKIDTVADVAPPGMGTGWVNPGQAALDFAPPGGYASANPVVVFRYDLLWSGDDITFSMITNPAQGRAMAIYINAAGTQQRIDDSQVTVNTARITIPAPATLTLLPLAVLSTRRRPHP